MKQYFIITTFLVFALAIVAASCKKQSKCPDGYNYSIQHSPPTLKSAAEDYCEEERNAVEQGVADSIQYATDVRVGFKAMPGPSTELGVYYWRIYGNWPSPINNLGDSVIVHREVTENWWELYGDPLPIPEDSIFRKLYNDGGMYLTQCDTMPILREALTECEKNVGITEWEWVDDPCGGYWTTSNAKR